MTIAYWLLSAKKNKRSPLDQKKHLYLQQHEPSKCFNKRGTIQYLYGNPNHPFQLTAVRSPSGSSSHDRYDDFGLLFALERDNNWYYITTDQLGTPRVVCDADGEPKALTKRFTVDLPESMYRKLSILAQALKDQE